MSAEFLRRFVAAGAAALQPPDRRPIAEWVEAHRSLPRGSAEEGMKRVSRTPAMRPIYEWFRDPFVREIVVVKSAQIGYTDAMVDILLWIAANDPAPTAMFFADQATAKRMMQSRIRPSLETIGMVRAKTNEKKQDATSYEVRLNNGFHLVVSWASSIAATASMAYKYIICDEVDKPGYLAAGAEGSSIGRIRERAETYPDSKILWGSTPTIETGLITREFNAADAQYDWCVPCPKCGAFQALRFGQEKIGEEISGGVAWEGGREATRQQIEMARYRCAHCAAEWTTDEKNAAVGRGCAMPRGERPARPKRVAYHVSRLDSLFPGGRLDALVGHWLKVQTDLTELQNFINSTLGEPWVQRIGQSQSDAVARVLSCRTETERNVVPPAAVVVMAGIDMQQDGFWYRIRAFAPDSTSWGLDEGFVPTWEALEHVLFGTVYASQDGKRYRVYRALIDVGGTKASDALVSRTEEAYVWLRSQSGRGCQLFGSRGATSSMPTKIRIGQPIDKTPSGKALRGGIQIVQVNTEVLKDQLWWRIERTVDGAPGGLYLHRDTPEYYAKHVTAEEKRLDRKGNAEWVRVRRDNHLLDCEVLCLAASDPEFWGGVRVFRKAPDAPPAQAPAPTSDRQPPQQTGNPHLRGTIGQHYGSRR